MKLIVNFRLNNVRNLRENYPDLQILLFIFCKKPTTNAFCTVMSVVMTENVFLFKENILEREWTLEK